MFWSAEHLSVSGGRAHAAEIGRTGFAELSASAGRIAESLSPPVSPQDKKLLLIYLDNSFTSLAAYVAALRSGHAAILLNTSIEQALAENIIAAYRPEIVVNASSVEIAAPGNFRQPPVYVEGARIWKMEGEGASAPHTDLAILLSTSGTTGSPKMVRLTYKNLQSNAESIAEYLSIAPAENAITSLPFGYSYGLSVINTHLLAGAGITLTMESMAMAGFWNLFREHDCTSFAGVPFVYHTLERLRFGTMKLPSLTVMTQAGGRLAPEKIRLFHRIAEERSAKFFVMYGQTEATARIAYVPWEALPEKTGSAGKVIPGGVLRVEGTDGASAPSGLEGEIVYEGPNVMMGYAMGRDCLSKGDELKGILRTGDLGSIDRDGFMFITGRLSRFIKIAGLRLGLDEMEKTIEGRLGTLVACAGEDEKLGVFIETQNATDVAQAKELITSLYHLHHTQFTVTALGALPLTSAGKKDYAAFRPAITGTSK